MTTEQIQQLLRVMRERTNELLSDPAKLKEWRKSVLGPARRELSETEAEQMLIVLKLSGTLHSSSNNQRTSTDQYHYHGKVYDVTYGLGDKPVVEELLEDE